MGNRLRIAGPSVKFIADAMWSLNAWLPKRWKRAGA
jgi:hypothetical protein